MKQRQVVAADAGSTSVGERSQPDQRPTRVPLGYTLSPEELDKVHGGFAGMFGLMLEERAPRYELIIGPVTVTHTT